MSEHPLYPFRFEPLFQRYLWGGTRLQSLLNKRTGAERAAESWEITDYPDQQSLVEYGSLKGIALGQLMRDWGCDILGPSAWSAVQEPCVPANLRGRFPLLIKMLDADQPLSVQVHPDDDYAKNLQPPDLGKTEAWYVLHAEPGSRIYSGLKSGVTRKHFAEAIQSGSSVELLYRFEPKVGDTVFIPAGTVHALGAGLVIAEIQQTSNTTFRVYDWDRVDTQGKPRPLHIAEALDVINFEAGPVEPLRIESSSTLEQHQIDELVNCDKFLIRRHRILENQTDVQLSDEVRCRIVLVTGGILTIQGDPANEPLERGQTILLPAALKGVRLSAATRSGELIEFLEILC